MQGVAKQMWDWTRGMVRSVWMVLIIYPGLGAGIAQGVLSAAVILGPWWNFPPHQDHQTWAYLLGYVVGVFYGLYVEYRRQSRQNTRGQDNKCCSCRPAGG